MNRMFLKAWTGGDVLGQAEVPADPHLPQLAQMLDAGTMGRIFQDELPGGFAEGRLRIERCRVVYVDYRPARTCLVSYSLDIVDSATGRHGTQVISGKVFAEERSESYLASCPKRMRAIPDFGLPFAYLSDCKMFLTAFPNDLRMRGLHQIIYPDELELVVRNALGLPEVRIEGVEDGSCPVKIVSYKPEQSCLIRCPVLRPDSASVRCQRRIIFGRMYSNDRGEQIYRAMVALWNGKARHSRLLSVAEPLGYDPTARVLFQGSVPGTCLTTLAGCEEFLHYVGLAARSLAAIHQTPVRLERSGNLDYELNRLELKARGLIQVYPKADEKLNWILGRLRLTMPSPQGQAWGLIHGDFSPGQILADGSRVSVIDFDTVRMSDSYADLGLFLARLEGLAVEGALQDSLRDRAAEEFCRQYEGAHPGALARDRLIWHQAMGFLREALSKLMHLRPGWPSLMDHCLSRAAALLSA